MVDSENKIKYFPSYLLIPLSSILIFSIGFVPLIIFIIGIQYIIPFLGVWFYLFLPLLVYAGISILLLSEMFFSGFIVRLFHIYYEPGRFKYHTREKNSLKWMIIVTVYTPIRKILEIIPTGGLKLSYLRLMGMKIGYNTLVGGVIKDPCVTTIGNHCTMGEYAIIYGHIHDFVDNTLSIESVQIGDNCVIGAGAIIMPGVIVEDDVTIAAGALVTKKQRLKKNSVYAGIPAKKIK
jgi:acetyltransferase-like isoleucine patch superfamily enzyme